jgi:hypothetical protein
MTTIISGSTGVDRVHTDAVTPAHITSGHMPTGSVLQVKFATYNTNFQTTANAWVNTGLSVTLTPRSVNSQVLVAWNQQAYISTGATWEGYKSRLLRNGTAVWTDPYSLSHAGHTMVHMTKDGDSYLDSPNTTDSITYTVQVLPTYVANMSFNHGTATSQIQALEVAG